MTPEQHQTEHIRLHRAFDELLACYLAENRKEMGRTSIHDEIFELMKWSYEKTLGPSPKPTHYGPVELGKPTEGQKP